MSFVQWRPDGSADALQILSKECFESWLRNRKFPREMQRPEDQFRRILTSHVTGAKKRRTFPPEVEADLLTHLHRLETWPCFRGRRDSNGKLIEIGKVGFRAIGYHERMQSTCRFSEPCMPPQSLQSSEEEHLDVPVVWETLDDDPIMSGPISPESFDGNLVAWISNDIEMQSSKPFSLPQPLPEKATEFSDKFFGDNDDYSVSSTDDVERFLQQSEKNMAARIEMYKCKSLWLNDHDLLEYLLNVFNISAREYVAAAHSEKRIEGDPRICLAMDLHSTSQTLRASLVKVILHTTSPSLFRSVFNETMPRTMPQVKEKLRISPRLLREDPRFKIDFRFPKEHAESFDRKRPMGEAVIDLETCQFVQHNEDALKILGAVNLNGRHVTELAVHSAVFWTSFRDFMPLLSLHGRVHSQGVIKRCDGNHIVLRSRAVCEANRLVVEFQDVTHLFQDILSSENEEVL